MSEVKKVTVQIAAPSRRYPAGGVAFGYYTLIDGVVRLTDPQGKAAGLETGREYKHKLVGDESALAWAAKLTKQLRLALRDKSASSVNDFNREIIYPDLKY
jgi:hypothetical protein